MATIKSAAQLKKTDVHSTLGAIGLVRRVGQHIFIKFTSGVTKRYHVNEHVSVQ